MFVNQDKCSVYIQFYRNEWAVTVIMSIRKVVETNLSEPSVKKYKLCENELPTLPIEIIHIILEYVDINIYIEVLGMSPFAFKSLLSNGQIKRYLDLTRFNYHPTTDKRFIEAAGATKRSIAPYLATFCSFETIKPAQNFFNYCIPKSVRIETLNSELNTTDEFIIKRWPWWKLVRNVIIHEQLMDRNMLICTFDLIKHFSNRDLYAENWDLSDVIYDMEYRFINSSPLRQVFIGLDINVIPLVSYNDEKMYRIVEPNQGEIYGIEEIDDDEGEVEYFGFYG